MHSIKIKEQPPPDEPGAPPPPGYVEVWGEDNLKWRLATQEEHDTKRCRRVGCPRQPVAAMSRSQRSQDDKGKKCSWWLYCDWHLYGRRVANGRVEGRRLVKADVMPDGLSITINRT